MDNELKAPTRMSKKELESELLALDYKEKDLIDNDGKKLSRFALLEKLQAHRSGEEGLAVLPDIEENSDDVGVEVSSGLKDIVSKCNAEQVAVPDCLLIDTCQQEELETPLQSDQGWTQYVLGKFADDEVDGGNPRVDGLRRVASELVGELIEEGCDLVSPPTENNRFRACAKAWGVFVTPGGLEKRFEALADAHNDNCLEDYSTYLVAMADTRAKGRMFRNALGLRRVVAAEEINKTVAIAADIQEGGPIHTGQISMIRLISDRNKFSITEVLDGLGIKYEMNDKTGDVNLQSLTYEDALATARKMREMKEEQEKNNVK